MGQTQDMDKWPVLFKDAISWAEKMGREMKVRLLQKRPMQSINSSWVLDWNKIKLALKDIWGII